MRQALHHNSTSGARYKTTLDVTRASKVVTCLNTHPSWWTCLIKTARIPLHLNMWWIQHRWKTWQPKGQKSSHSSCWKGTTSPHLSNLLDHTETRRHLKQIGMDCDRQHFQSRHRIQDKNWQRIREVQKLIKESAKPKVFSKHQRCRHSLKLYLSEINCASPHGRHWLRRKVGYEKYLNTKSSSTPRNWTRGRSA